MIKVMSGYPRRLKTPSLVFKTPGWRINWVLTKVSLKSALAKAKPGLEAFIRPPWWGNG
jgi:hypothetical protein